MYLDGSLNYLKSLSKDFDGNNGFFNLIKKRLLETNNMLNDLSKLAHEKNLSCQSLFSLT